MCSLVRNHQSAFPSGCSSLCVKTQVEAELGPGLHLRSEVPVFMEVMGTRVAGTVQGIRLLEEGPLGVLGKGLVGLDPPFSGFHTARALG